MTYEVTVYLTAAWRLGEQRGPLRYSAATGHGYGTPNCETFWEAVGQLVRLMAWGSGEEMPDPRAGRNAATLVPGHWAA